MATTPLSTDQPTQVPEPGQAVSAVRLVFAQCKVEFAQMHIQQPLVFIKWKRPELSDDEVRRIRMGLTGRAAGSDMHLADVCMEVIKELKAAA